MDLRYNRYHQVYHEQQDVRCAEVDRNDLRACYTALSGIWGWPYGDQIVGSLFAIEIFLGTVLQISSAKYKKKNA